MKKSLVYCNLIRYKIEALPELNLQLYNHDESFIINHRIKIIAKQQNNCSS